MSSPEFVEIFHRFGVWLIGQIPAKKAALTIHGYFPFFYEIEKRWGKIPSYEQLLVHFTAEGLRRVRLPMRWLSETLQVSINAMEREIASDRRRIAAIMASIPIETTAAKILNSYNLELQSRIAAGRLSIRSARLALRPAASLLASCEKIGNKLPKQNTLDSYLLKTPGQKASIFGFIKFLNRRYATNLVIQVNAQKTILLRRKQLETELIRLLESGKCDDTFEEKWISVSLSFFHDLPWRKVKNLKHFSLSTDADGNFLVSLSGKTYFVPHWNFRSCSSQLEN
ncbi:hypothetical protein [Undibacterium luofuense]|uniref:Uncharacterized protein n=1 Tax=Undibacterium luofuense TaxID=2828733 RepID=A0A941DKT1_9BURK|nr:hypothetical protein [Undibacterium luofuense]MBR7780621.1 hypothetical protein [Undibacterium luofuense]